MSLGPSSLGNLLVQRLDTALGVTQPAQNRTGAHPDALRQSQPPHRINPSEEQRQRASQESVDKARQQGRTSVGRQDARIADQLKSYTDNRFTASAPTTLGRTARTLLTLLNNYNNQPVQGRQPLMQPQQLAQLLRHGGNAPAGQTPAGSAQTQLSGAQARLAASTQAQAQTSGASSAGGRAMSPQLASPATGTASLSALANTIGGATTLVSAFTQALAQNVQQSGMFYEAHLAQLVKGQGNLALLRQQPQAQLQEQAQQAANQGKTAAAQSAKGTEPTASTVLQQAGIDPAVQQLVRQQLDVLANQLFLWRGEAWPGAMMEWEIQRRHEDESSEQQPTDESEKEAPWQTRLRVDLPQLGQVETRLYIEDKKLRLHIHAPASASQLTENRQQLVQRLQAQGLQIEQFQISRQDEHDPTSPHYVHEPE